MTTLPVVIYTDGGARGNPGPAAIGVVIMQAEQELYSLGQVMGVATNNEAEYQAVMSGLKYLVQHQELVLGQTLELRMDSLLVASQLMGQYKIKEPRLKDLAAQCLGLLRQLAVSYRIIHVPRHQNAVADALVNQALDADAYENRRYF